MTILNWLGREDVLEIVKKILFKIKEKLFFLETYNNALLYKRILRNIIYGKSPKILEGYIKILNIKLKQTPYDVKVR